MKLLLRIRNVSVQRSFKVNPDKDLFEDYCYPNKIAGVNEIWMSSNDVVLIFWLLLNKPFNGYHNIKYQQKIQICSAWKYPFINFCALKEIKLIKWIFYLNPGTIRPFLMASFFILSFLSLFRLPRFSFRFCCFPCFRFSSCSTLKYQILSEMFHYWSIQNQSHWYDKHMINIAREKWRTKRFASKTVSECNLGVFYKYRSIRNST